MATTIAHRFSKLRITIVTAGLTMAAAAIPLSGATANASTPSIDRGRAAVHALATDSTAQASARAYWTKDRMEHAVPFERLVGRNGAAHATPHDITRGTPSIVPGRPGTVTSKAFPASGGPYPGQGKIRTTAGRVFFTFQGRDAACSGDAVTSANKSVVVTAGHCVKYQGTWHTNWVFVPGYDHGNKPFGTWSAAKTLTTPQWNANEDENYDVGMAVVNPLNGKALTDVVGSQGIAFNQARNEAMYAFGYPAADPYDGETLDYCSGDTFTDFLLTQDHAMACDLTGGSSGGPWFLSFDESSGTGVQASVNSFGYTFLPGYMFGPYFGADVQTLYNTAQGS